CAGLELLVRPFGFFPLAERRPSVVHQRHVTSTVPLAVVRAGRFAAAAEPFAIVLSAAGMLLRRCARALAAARVFAPFALPFAVVQSAAKMHIDLGNCGIAAGRFCAAL